MNNKPSDKIILKYLLYVYAYVIKWKIKNRWSISFTSDDSLMKDFDIINNPTYMLNRLLNMGVLYLSNSSYLPKKNAFYSNQKGYHKQYDILLSYFDELQNFLPFFYDLEEEIQNNKYLSTIKEQLDNIANKNKEIEDNSIFKHKGRGKPKVNYSQSDYLYQDNYNEVVDILKNTLFIDEIPNDDITKIVNDKTYDDIDLLYGTVDEKDKYPNIIQILKRLRNRKIGRLKHKTTFGKIFIKYDKVYDEKQCRYVNKKICKEVTEEELQYLKKVYTALIIYQGYIKELSNRIEMLRKLGVVIYCKLHIDVYQQSTQIVFENSARQYNTYDDIGEHSHKELGHRTNLFTIEGYDSSYDLHSTVFVVARLLNKGDWYKNPKFDDDLKLDLLSRKKIIKEDGTQFAKEDLKKLSYRIFFQTTKKKSLSSYSRAVEFDKRAARSGRTKVFEKKNGRLEWRDFVPHISMKDYEFLYDSIYDICGDLTQYVETIFYYESILECLIMERVITDGKKIRNTYDCFYYDSKEFTKEQFIKLVDEVAMDFYHLYLNNQKLSLWWDDIDNEKLISK